MNPYQSPCDNHDPAHDWSLAKRMARAVAVILVFTFAICAANLWRTYRRANSNLVSSGSVQELWEFFTSGKAP